MATVSLVNGQTWTVPTGVTSIQIDACGAAGGDVVKTGSPTSTGGKPSAGAATLTVAAGATVKCQLGLAGHQPGSGFPDGRAGDSYYSGSGGGGGSTTVWLNGAKLLIAAGGGGAGGSAGPGSGSISGGDGGYPSGGGGGLGSIGDNREHVGGGATQSADGTGLLGKSGGGGGGGYHKGGSGYASGGGGGSSWKSTAAGTVTWTTPAVVDGYTRITYTVSGMPPTPTVLTPASLSAQDVADDVTFSWTHNGADDQTQADLEWQLVTGGTVYTATPTTAQTDDEALTVGAWHWRVRTYGTAAIASPWTGWTSFSVATAPDAPIISLPVDASTITTPTTATTWTATGQTAAQIRVVADDGYGSPDMGVVLWDSGTLATAVGSGTVTFPSDGADVHVAVRIMADGLWSPWATVKVSVTWARPAVPVVKVRADDARAAIVGSWTQPAGAPVDHYEVSVIEDGVRSNVWATLAPDVLNWTYWTPANDVAVTMIVRAYSTLGAYSESEAT